jgi:hypothetical protein
MTDAELLEHVARRLNQCSVPFMVVGSVASSYHGEPRVSYDIDLVIDATAEQVEQFVASFGPPFYVSDIAARQAVRRRGMFNVIHPECRCKVDLILLKDRDFARSQFERRMPALVWGVTTEVASAGDTILAKLSWSRRGGSERQFRDAVGVAFAQSGKLDTAYLWRWAAHTNIEDLLERALAEAEEERRQQDSQ